MKRILSLLTVLVLVLVGLCGCSSSVPDAQTYAARAWTATGRKDTPSTFCYMHYQSTDQLATSVAMPDATVALIPSSGYVYLIAPTDGFDGLCVVFATDSGNVVSTLSYTQLTGLYSATNAAVYLEAANYLAYLYLNAISNSVSLSSDERQAQWYAFSEEQIRSILAAQ